MVECINLCKITLTIGTFIVALTIGSYFGVDTFLKSQINKRLSLKNNETFQNWLNPPVVVYRKYYLFSVENPIEVQQGKEKANLRQMGPYVYREILEKKNIEFTSNDLLTYSPVSTLYFEPSLSNGTLDDSVMFPNIPAIALIEEVTKTDMIFIMVGMFQIFNVKLFQLKTVNELITGYDDQLLNLGKMADPKKVKTSKFSLLNDRNGTINHNLTVYIGSEDANMGKVYAVNSLNKLTVWLTDNANTLKGSDGIIYPPYLKRDKQIHTYNVEMCRSLKWTYLNDNKIDGVKTYDFHLAKDVYYNSTLNPENEGFCSDDDCLGNGVFNLSRCLGGISMFGSLPHFLNAEDKFVNGVNGLNPNYDQHDYIISLHPLTGAPVRAKARFQLNINVPNNPYLEIVKNVKPFLLPLFWIEVDAEVTSETKKSLNQLSQIMNIVTIVHFVALIIGCVLVLISVVFMFSSCSKKGKISKGKNYLAVKITN